MDYRLVPETLHQGQLEDVSDIRPWLTDSLPTMPIFTDLKVNRGRILVVGASAGAQLALLTPHLWKDPPIAVVSLYGPTNMHGVVSLGSSRLSQYPRMEVRLDQATNFGEPPTYIEPPEKEEDFLTPRAAMTRFMIMESLVPYVLIRGLPNCNWPQASSVSDEEIDAISPLHCFQKSYEKHPPVYQLVAAADDIFHNSHGVKFHDLLERRGVKCAMHIVPDIKHADDIWEKIGGDFDQNIIALLVQWVVEAIA
ncbi:alpha/beta-hydrolase [Cadophora sp. DSE1049]|nr:alpha/beta-hydrolase [Cadophora sp. DSE1049]